MSAERLSKSALTGQGVEAIAERLVEVRTRIAVAQAELVLLREVEQWLGRVLGETQGYVPGSFPTGMPSQDAADPTDMRSLLAAVPAASGATAVPVQHRGGPARTDAKQTLPMRVEEYLSGQTLPQKVGTMALSLFGDSVTDRQVKRTRAAVESLVARGQAARIKRGGAVYYEASA
ncbi:hypothetical protein [Streptacidiphilus anmyonensis]|uniref:hypothetical protein n=1 Tax=Streptacidiphilus anmyonensis TaxID=405782 RepID=UPI0005A5EA12|nr:hypothetical protein [Streptacidiphilus anmyonensis]